MKRFLVLAALFFGPIVGLPPTTLVAQDDRSDYVSDASFIIATYQPQSPGQTPEAIAQAANAFLDSLDDTLRERANHAIDSPERRKWTNLPARPDAGGVRLGDCNETQQKAFCDLLASLLSQQGYNKMRNIMLADDQLLRGGRPRPGFGTETFSVVVFGTPSPTDPWAFQLDGHHVGVNVAVHGKAMTLSPSFIGTQPEAFRIGGQQIRPLANEVDGAFKLAASLNAEQRREAVISSRRGRIQTGPGNDSKVPTPQGVSCATFDPAQKEILMTLISQWVGDLPAAQAKQRMKQLADEIDETYFAWSGPTRPDSDVSFKIQGPTLIIEYACQDLGGNPLDHLHTMYRDPTNEYGKQLKKN